MGLWFRVAVETVFWSFLLQLVFLIAAQVSVLNYLDQTFSLWGFMIIYGALYFSVFSVRYAETAK